MKRKIDLFNKLYKEIAGHGINGDTELAHINKYEAVALKAMGGSGTVNNITGLKEYWGDDPEPAPAPAATTTVKQVSDLPEYFKPYVEELFATAQDVYDRPYKKYEGERLAPVSAEQKAAFAGLRDMFTTVDEETGVRSFRDPTSEGFTEATRLSERGAKGFDELAEGEFQETYMSPYKQAVTDIQVREAEKKQEAMRRKRQGAARMANALGGGRFGAEQAMAGFYDQQLLDDIQKKGLQEAYDTGLKVFDSDRLAARAGATQRAGMTTDEFTSGLKGLGALQSTGETQRAIAQQPLDIKYEEFARQEQFPKQNLQELSGILRGFQVQPTTYQTSQQYKPPQSLGQQLLAAGTLGAGISKGLGKSLLGNKAGGVINAASGGTVSPNPQAAIEGGRGFGGMGLMADLFKEVIAQRQAAGLPIPFMKNQNPNEQIDMEEQVGIFAEAAGGGLMSLANGGMTEERKARFRKRSKNPALGVILGGKPVVTVDEEGETVDAVVPSLLDVLKQVQREEIKPGEAPKPKLKSNAPPVSVDEFEEFSKIEIPEGADDELTQEEFLEQVTTGATPSDSDSGFNIEKLLSQYAEGFDAAAPYLASFAKQKGWDDSAEGLKGISDAALKKAQMEYYKGLGQKAKDYRDVERLKAGAKFKKNKIDALVKNFQERLEIIKSKITAEGASTPELDAEAENIIKAMQVLVTQGYGTDSVGIGLPTPRTSTTLPE
tara:strand:+ start:771 stop:2927 length:2157 start_codon:yes stop_codon:yes gene_type:complete